MLKSRLCLIYFDIQFFNKEKKRTIHLKIRFSFHVKMLVFLNEIPWTLFVFTVLLWILYTSCEHTIKGESLIFEYNFNMDFWGRKNNIFPYHFFQFGPVEKMRAVENPSKISLFIYITRTNSSIILIFGIKLFTNFRNLSRTQNVLMNE